jgi:hypothetical protein
MLGTAHRRASRLRSKSPAGASGTSACQRRRPPSDGRTPAQRRRRHLVNLVRFVTASSSRSPSKPVCHRRYATRGRDRRLSPTSSGEFRSFSRRCRVARRPIRENATCVERKQAASGVVLEMWLWPRRGVTRSGHLGLSCYTGHRIFTALSITGSVIRRWIDAAFPGHSADATVCTDVEAALSSDNTRGNAPLTPGRLDLL